MSENTNVEKAEKIQRCVISNLKYDAEKHLVSLEADLAGKLQKGTEKNGIEWSIDVARTKLTVVNVPLRELLVKTFVGWFWVRIIQDTLRKGTKADALTAMKAGFDWTESTTKKAESAAPAVVGARVIAKMDTAEQLAELIAAAEKRIKELAEAENKSE